MGFQLKSLDKCHTTFSKHTEKSADWVPTILLEDKLHSSSFKCVRYGLASVRLESTGFFDPEKNPDFLL